MIISNFFEKIRKKNGAFLCNNEKYEYARFTINKKLKNFDLSWVDIEAKESLKKIGPVEYKIKQQTLKGFIQHISGKLLLILFLFTCSK